MARVSSKHDRMQEEDFEGFLNNLQDWELSLKHNKMDKPNSKLKNTNLGNFPKIGDEDYLKKYDTLSNLSTAADDTSVDANSEKELGNEFFKQRKYKQAIDCYSRSLALSPTAVAYANRAMAYLKLKRFKEAEDDCTEALNLDDRYVKAYSRRSTARKELGKLKDSKEDADFALRLEPQNQEIKKQYADAKSLYDKELVKKASESLKGSTQEVQKELKLNNGPRSIPKISELSRATETKTESPVTNHNVGKKDLRDSVQQLASRAASLATAEAAKNIEPPTSAYQFEALWRRFSGDCTLQGRLLKATNPVALPQIFKNALSAPLLIGIIRCIATFFSDDTDMAVKYLENLPKVSRFNMIIMCLSSADKSDLHRIWDEIFCNKDVAPGYLEKLLQLRPRYCIK